MAEKDGSYFFILTKQFKFLDVCKFLAPGTSYSKWIGSHGWKDSKLVFPYEWLDDFGKLSRGPPAIEAFTTRMRARSTMTDSHPSIKKRVVTTWEIG